MTNRNKAKLIGIKLGSEYGVLNKQFIQFDPQYKIAFFNDDGHDEINISYNNEDIQDFFGKRVDYISGVVGKNGVGKSTIIRYVKDLFLKESSDLQERENDIILFQEEGVIYAYGNERLKSSFRFGRNDTNLNIELIYYRRYPKIYDRLKNFTTVFYSNSLNQGERESETTNFFNISTNFLSENIGKINKNLKNKNIRNQSGARRFRFTELMRQIDFVNALSNREIDLDIPFKSIHKVSLRIEPVKQVEYRKMVSNIQQFLKNIKLSSHYREYLEQLCARIMAFSKEMEQRRKSERNVGMGLVLNIFENFNLYLFRTFLGLENILSFEDHVSQSLDMFFNENTHDFFPSETRHRLEEKLMRLRDNLTHISSMHSELKIGEKVLEQLKYGEKFLHQLFQLIPEQDEHAGHIDISTREPRLGEFLRDFFGNSYDFQFLSFAWPSLSAGESSLIAFFSRLYSISEDFRSENILLLIDEGDLYFHPEWQRDYIYFLLQFLNSMISDNKHTSIILTTHSPFLLSDLPSDNVILLLKESNEFSRVARPDQFEMETFGGNIHTLFSKAFFLDESTVSRFAKDKIKNEIILPLQSQKGQVSRVEIDKLINKVGEPVLNLALRELFNKRYDPLS